MERRSPLLIASALTVIIVSLATSSGAPVLLVVPGADAKANSVVAVSCPTENSHAAVLIQSDSEFTTANGVVLGTGTSNDPYIVGDMKFDDLSPGYGLKIDNSAGGITVHFDVRCLTTSYEVVPADGAALLIVDGVHGAATVASISGNGGETVGTIGVLIEASSDITITGLELNKLGGTALEVASSDHVTIVDSKLKSTAHGGDGLLITGSHDVRVGSTCNPQGGEGCDELTYDDARGLHILNSYNIFVLNTVVASDDTGDILIEGANSFNITLSSSSASAWGPICHHGTATGLMTDTVSGIAITSGAHDITVENYSITSFGTSIMNGGNGLYLNPCTRVEQPVPQTAPGGGGYTFIDVCWKSEFGFSPIPPRVCA